MTTDEFLKKARELACEYLSNESKGTYEPKDIQVVWMAHVMGDKKAILFMPGTYSLFEVTYDMKSDALYFDAYAKKAHKAIEACNLPGKKAKDAKEEAKEDKYDDKFSSLAEELFEKLFNVRKNTSTVTKIKVTRL